MLMSFRKTPVAAKELGHPPWVLANLIRYQKIEPPVKDSSGDFLWTDGDVERARQALANRRGRERKPVEVAHHAG